MAPTKFTPETCQRIVVLVRDGVTIKDAARLNDVGLKTVKNWLSRGRREDDGPYSDFAAAVDAARQEADEREGPMDMGELRLAVSRAARKGSVAAQKLLWEIIKTDDGDGDEGEDQDPFAALDGEDELAARRSKAS